MDKKEGKRVKKKANGKKKSRSRTFLSLGNFFIGQLLFYRSTTFFSPGNFLVGRLLFYPFGLFFIHLPSFISNPLLLYLPTCVFYHSCSFITKTTHVLCWYQLVTWCVHTVNSFGERAMWRGGLDFERRVDLVNIFEKWIGWIFFFCFVWIVQFELCSLKSVQKYLNRYPWQFGRARRVFEFFEMCRSSVDLCWSEDNEKVGCCFVNYFFLILKNVIWMHIGILKWKLKFRLHYDL